MRLRNGRIWTGDAWLSELDLGGDDGRTIDLRGRLALPAFIDNHTHFVHGGFGLTSVQLRDAATPDEFARRIAAHARKLGAGRWVTRGQWDQTLWPGAPLPSRQLIDDVTPENPVFVTRLDIHMGVANSLALKLAGITRETPDPPGGAIVRDASGEPTGVLKDRAMDAVYAVIPSPTLEERAAAARAALAEAARFGVTALCDMSGPDALDDARAYERIELTACIKLFTPEPRDGFGFKSFADGSLGSATAAMFEPFCDDPSNRGLLLLDDALRARIRDADRRNIPIALHAIGDRANDEALRLFESLPPQRRFRIEHAQHLGPDLVRRFARAGVIASMQPYHAVDDGRWMTVRIGADRARWAYAFRDLLDAGVTVTFGSDWPVAPLDPLLGLRAAMSRGVTFEEALRGYTVHNAFAMFREHDLGRLGAGFKADAVVLSEPSIENAVVDLTIFGGNIIYER